MIDKYRVGDKHATAQTEERKRTEELLAYICDGIYGVACIAGSLPDGDDELKLINNRLSEVAGKPDSIVNV